MCDVCSDFLQLLISYETHLTESKEQYKITENDISVLLLYVQTWPARQCMCCYRDPKNLDRFALLTQSLIYLCVLHLKDLRIYLPDTVKNKTEDEKQTEKQEPKEPPTEPLPEVKPAKKCTEKDSSKDQDTAKDKIESCDELNSLGDKEKLFHLVAKIFLINFPLYVAYKHVPHAQLDEVGGLELAGLNLYCDLHDQEVPVHLLRNVTLFCKAGGIQAMTLCFQHLAPDILPVSTAHAIIAIVCNLKLWLNFKTTLAMLVPLRSRVLRYMCRLADTELRTPSIKSMADFMWSAVKDPLEMPQGLDSDGLDLAFKYFTSSTLTMRLAGVSQINSHISLMAEMCGGDSAQAAPKHMADWLITNNIVTHIFGPNLHVEVIKQSHVILNFLAMEGRITSEHVDAMWAAAQLKHCSRPVHELLPGLIKHLNASVALHLYGLLTRLEPREHTEQTLYLASALTKFIWSRAGAGTLGGAGAAAADTGSVEALHKCESSENSVSIDGTNSDEEQTESHKSASEEEEEAEEEEDDEEVLVDSEGPTPCKQPRTHRTSSFTTESGKSEENSEKKNVQQKKTLLEKQASSARKKILVNSPPNVVEHPSKRTSSGLLEGTEPIASSSSADEEITEEENRTSRIRTRILHKHHSHKKSKRVNFDRPSIRRDPLLSDGDSDIEPTPVKHMHHMSRAKSRTGMRGPMVSVYLGDSSSGSESGKPFIGPLGPHGSPCQPFIPELDPCRAEQLLELLSGDEGEGDVDGSYSSRMSNKSEKNMGDFDGEESACEEELSQLAAQAQLTSQCLVMQQCVLQKSPSRPDPRFSACFKIDNVCQPGNTLLWDLLQDNKIGQLGEGLALDAEKVLCNLLCYSTDRIIRMKFIEGCLHNLANNWSVVISLRLLPKLLASFQQFRSLDTHHVTHWADKQRMMEHFFSNLRTYTEAHIAGQPPQPLGLYSHQTHVQVRLHFLSAIYSPLGSPKNFKLSVEQVDILWECLAHDPDCADELFSWLLAQARGNEQQHALGSDALKRLYITHLPALPPESLSPTGLALFQQLCNLARTGVAAAISANAAANSESNNEKNNADNAKEGSVDDTGKCDAGSKEGSNMENKAEQQEGQKRDNSSGNIDKEINVDSIETSNNLSKHPELIGMEYLWRVALRANNTDVSISAIQYLNNYYLGQRLQHAEAFVSQCMLQLAAATKDLNPPCSLGEDAPLLRIQRALLLLKTHLDTFRKRYAYHLRRWTLEGQSIGCHGSAFDRVGSPLRVLIQLAGMSERTPLDLHTTDFVAELRAEAIQIWETVRVKPSSSKDESGVLGSLLHEGPIRMITQGQELTTEFDEKTLIEVGFKENQLVFISMGANRSNSSGGRKRESSESVSLQPAPPRDTVPMLLLLRPLCFEQLFELMHTLSAMRTTGKGGNEVPHTKAQVLSRRVWDILTTLPTNPTLLRGFQNLDIPLSELLAPTSPQKLMYSLHIVETLAQASSSSSGSLDKNKSSEPWSTKFVKSGGLRHLFEIFMSGVLQRNDGDNSEWQQDCLASLLKLLNKLGVNNSETSSSSSRCYKHFIPTLNEVMLSMMDVPATMERLMSILHEVSLPRDPNYYKTGFWGRAQVVHYAMFLLVSWLHCSEEARQSLFQAKYFESWLLRLVLEEPEPSVRKEVCAALYRLCLGTTSQSGYIGAALTGPLLSRLLIHLPKAEKMRPQNHEALHHPEDGKEPYGPACRDYFWLVCRLVDGLTDESVKETLDDQSNISLDVNDLCKRVNESIISREFFEVRHRTVEDDGLIGLLNLMTNLIKHRPAFQTSKEGRHLMLEVFDYLFLLPTPRQRHLPKCKSSGARAAAYDLLVELVKGAPDNYAVLHEKLLQQHKPGPHSPYPWDYWPHDDGRSECGYVGLTNLGATCYMASCMQHLYMMPQARCAILAASTAYSKHEATLKELQRMFAYLLESERKAYNPRSFCKVYTMDHQPLNTGEQKDMAEFFIDLVSKLEEMTPQLKTVIKTLFCGILSNNVVSLDCEHVSRTLEEFYTVRCQVADMRNLYESLDEVTVKDTLEGDNMYTCSQCGKKVRAEKRACFKKLPHILCFNTMRYTFNMVTMLKEKVNTHFSFPLRLNMAGYVEKQLMPQQYQEERQHQGCNDPEPEHYEYDLIGVTVHTGTADGGHYYSFIKDRGGGARDKWLLFNDAEVKPFDPNQIAAECFGGEMTSKTYDSVTDKFMDFSFEKTNSAYMLFYEYSSRHGSDDCSPSTTALDYVPVDRIPVEGSSSSEPNMNIELSKELEDWIWKDNMHFIQDKNIFEHAYFNFMWQICGYIPQTLLSIQPDITQKAAELSTSFFIETFIHAKEKPTMVQWVELVTKQFNACQQACQWFLNHMATDTWWPVQVLIKCPNQMVRQMFQRLCIHVVQRLRSNHASLYLLRDDEDLEKDDDSDDSTCDPDKIGNKSCVTKFIKSLLSLMEHGAKAHLKHLTEYFGFLYEFCRMGDEETKFLLSVNAIHSMVNFYLGHKAHDFVDVSDGEDEEEVIALPTDKYKPASLDKMIALIAMLVERSRGPDQHLRLSAIDYTAVAGSKGFPFLYQQIKDNINLQQTRNLIHSLCRGNERLASLLVSMLSQAISRHPEACQPLFKLLTLLTEGGGSGGTGAGLPCFTQLVLQRVWEAAECCPHSALDWLALQVARNKLVHTWVLQSVDTWLEHFLIAHANQRVRSAAAFLLVSLVPSVNFRQCYRARSNSSGTRGDVSLPSEAQIVLHQVYTSLLRLLGPAKLYIDIHTHGTTKLTAYFALLTYCVVSRTEKLMFGQYFMQLWHLFHPGLSEPSVPAHHNKQALLVFWHHVCVDCPENIQLVLHNAHVTKNIAFNYILADHDDQEVVLFNRAMLPAYYGLLRLCCQQSRTFTRQLAAHQNLQWAFKNITPHPTQYTAAVDELFKLMQLFVMKHMDATEQEIRDINVFRRSTLSAYLQCLDGRTGWATLISAFRILIENDDDRLFIVYNGGLQLVFESLITLHVMYHEGGTCQVTGELIELLSLCLELVRCFRRGGQADTPPDRTPLLSCKDWLDALRKLATLLNTYNPPQMRTLCIDILKEVCVAVPRETLHALIPLLSHCHAAFQDSHNAVPLGQYFPRRESSVVSVATSTSPPRPLRPMVQMVVPHNQVELPKGTDPEYDEALRQFYAPYHELIDVLCRVAINNDCLSDVMVTFSAMVGFEAVMLHSTFFPKLWLDILRSPHIDRKYITMLTSCTYFVDYVDTVLLDERAALTVDVIYEFLSAYFSKVSAHVLTDQTCALIDSLVTSLGEAVAGVRIRSAANRLAGDLRALLLVYAAAPRLLRTHASRLVAPLKTLKEKISAELGDDDDTTPVKKRKVTPEEETETASTNTEPEPQPGCSHDYDKASPKTPPKLKISDVSSIKTPDSTSKKRLDDASPETAENETSKNQDTTVYNLKLLDSVIRELSALVEKVDAS